MSELNNAVEVSVSALSGPALDWAVGYAVREDKFVAGQFAGSREAWALDWICSASYSPSTEWAQCGPLIDKHAIGFWGYDADNWQAQSSPEDVVYTGIGPTHLIAACRLIVAAKFGKVVSVPKELIS